MLRPGDGISPMRLPEIIEKKAVRDLDSGHMLKIEDFQ